MPGIGEVPQISRPVDVLAQPSDDRRSDGTIAQFRKGLVDSCGFLRHFSFHSSSRSLAAAIPMTRAATAEAVRTRAALRAPVPVFPARLARVLAFPVRLARALVFPVRLARAGAQAWAAAEEAAASRAPATRSKPTLPTTRSSTLPTPLPPASVEPSSTERTSSRASTGTRARSRDLRPCTAVSASTSPEPLGKKPTASPDDVAPPTHFTSTLAVDSPTLTLTQTCPTRGAPDTHEYTAEGETLTVFIVDAQYTLGMNLTASNVAHAWVVAEKRRPYGASVAHQGAANGSIVRQTDGQHRAIRTRRDVRKYSGNDNVGHVQRHAVGILLHRYRSGQARSRWRAPAERGYRIVSVRPPEDDPQGFHWLHVERIETHSVDSLHARNDELDDFAEELELHAYDGMDSWPGATRSRATRRCS